MFCGTADLNSSHFAQNANHCVVLESKTCVIKCLECDVEVLDTLDAQKLNGSQTVFEFRSLFFKTKIDAFWSFGKNLKAEGHELIRKKTLDVSFQNKDGGLETDARDRNGKRIRGGKREITSELVGIANKMAKNTTQDGIEIIPQQPTQGTIETTGQLGTKKRDLEVDTTFPPQPMLPCQVNLELNSIQNNYTQDSILQSRPITEPNESIAVVFPNNFLGCCLILLYTNEIVRKTFKRMHHSNQKRQSIGLGPLFSELLALIGEFFGLLSNDFSVFESTEKIYRELIKNQDFKPSYTEEGFADYLASFLGVIDGMVQFPVLAKILEKKNENSKNLEKKIDQNSKNLEKKIDENSKISFIKNEFFSFLEISEICETCSFEKLKNFEVGINSFDGFSENDLLDHQNGNKKMGFFKSLFSKKHKFTVEQAISYNFEKNEQKKCQKCQKSIEKKSQPISVSENLLVDFKTNNKIEIKMSENFTFFENSKKNSKISTSPQTQTCPPPDYVLTFLLTQKQSESTPTLYFAKKSQWFQIEGSTVSKIDKISPILSDRKSKVVFCNFSKQKAKKASPLSLILTEEFEKPAHLLNTKTIFLPFPLVYRAIKNNEALSPFLSDCLCEHNYFKPMTDQLFWDSKNRLTPKNTPVLNYYEGSFSENDFSALVYGAFAVEISQDTFLKILYIENLLGKHLENLGVFAEPKICEICVESGKKDLVFETIKNLMNLENINCENDKNLGNLKIENKKNEKSFENFGNFGNLNPLVVNLKRFSKEKTSFFRDENDCLTEIESISGPKQCQPTELKTPKNLVSCFSNVIGLKKLAHLDQKSILEKLTSNFAVLSDKNLTCQNNLKSLNEALKTAISCKLANQQKNGQISDEKTKNFQILQILKETNKKNGPEMNFQKLVTPRMKVHFEDEVWAREKNGVKTCEREEKNCKDKMFVSNQSKLIGQSFKRNSRKMGQCQTSGLNLSENCQKMANFSEKMANFNENYQKAETKGKNAKIACKSISNEQESYEFNANRPVFSEFSEIKPLGAMDIETSFSITIHTPKLSTMGNCQVGFAENQITSNKKLLKSIIGKIDLSEIKKSEFENSVFKNRGQINDVNFEFSVGQKNRGFGDNLDTDWGMCPNRRMTTDFPKNQTIFANRYSNRGMTEEKCQFLNEKNENLANILQINFDKNDFLTDLEKRDEEIGLPQDTLGQISKPKNRVQFAVCPFQVLKENGIFKPENEENFKPGFLISAKKSKFKNPVNNSIVTDITKSEASFLQKTFIHQEVPLKEEPKIHVIFKFHKLFVKSAVGNVKRVIKNSLGIMVHERNVRANAIRNSQRGTFMLKINKTEKNESALVIDLAKSELLAKKINGMVRGEGGDVLGSGEGWKNTSLNNLVEKNESSKNERVLSNNEKTLQENEGLIMGENEVVNMGTQKDGGMSGTNPDEAGIVIYKKPDGFSSDTKETEVPPQQPQHQSKIMGENEVENMGTQKDRGMSGTNPDEAGIVIYKKPDGFSSDTKETEVPPQQPQHQSKIMGENEVENMGTQKDRGMSGTNPDEAGIVIYKKPDGFSSDTKETETTPQQTQHQSQIDTTPEEKLVDQKLKTWFEDFNFELSGIKRIVDSSVQLWIEQLVDELDNSEEICRLTAESTFEKIKNEIIEEMGKSCASLESLDFENLTEEIFSKIKFETIEKMVKMGGSFQSIDFDFFSEEIFQKIRNSTIRQVMNTCESIGGDNLTEESAFGKSKNAYSCESIGLEKLTEETFEKIKNEITEKMTQNHLYTYESIGLEGLTIENVENPKNSHSCESIATKNLTKETNLENNVQNLYSCESIGLANLTEETFSQMRQEALKDIAKNAQSFQSFGTECEADPVQITVTMAPDTDSLKFVTSLETIENYKPNFENKAKNVLIAMTPDSSPQQPTKAASIFVHNVSSFQCDESTSTNGALKMDSNSSNVLERTNPLQTNSSERNSRQKTTTENPKIDATLKLDLDTPLVLKKLQNFECSETVEKVQNAFLTQINNFSQKNEPISVNWSKVSFLKQNQPEKAWKGDSPGIVCQENQSRSQNTASEDRLRKEKAKSFLESQNMVRKTKSRSGWEKAKENIDPMSERKS